MQTKGRTPGNYYMDSEPDGLMKMFMIKAIAEQKQKNVEAVACISDVEIGLYECLIFYAVN